MKLTLSWLREFVDLPEDPQSVSDAFDSLGFEVEAMDALAPAFRGVVVGRVESVAAHPDADKVRVCQVDIGSAVSEIVCGAWNFEAGAIVPVAVPGAVLQGDFEIGSRKIRGVVSNGMICSEAELELGEDAEGIMVLDDDYPAAASHVGENFADLLAFPDTLYDLTINPNRPDAMSVLGLARELAAHFDTALREPDFSVIEAEPASTLEITIEDPEACPRFVGREVRNVAVGTSPHWLRARLTAGGVRPINNVVDASNYAMIEVGHPTHAFDADLLGDRIGVRRARSGESVVTLDGAERELEATDIVVTNGDRTVAIGGVMGGAETEVSETTTRVVIEAAYWDPPSILLTSKRLNLRSEASARFERGMDPNFCHLAADRVAQLLAAHAGGEIVTGRSDAYPRPVEASEIALLPSEITRVLGVEIPPSESAGHLRRLGFGVSGDDPMMVAVPTRRPDVHRPVDLIEDIARLHGYNAIPNRVATGPGGGLPKADRRVRKLRSVMAGAGLHEVLTFSFIGAADLDALGLADHDARRVGVGVVNPLRDEEGVMRTTLLPGLLKAVAINQGRRIASVGLFEIGKVFIPGSGKLPEQPEHLGFVISGERDGDWTGPGRPVDVRDGTGIWELIADQMRLSAPSVQRTHADPFHPGRAAEASVHGLGVGVVGEIHPRVVERFGISGRVIAGELDLASLIADRDDWLFNAPSAYPPSLFDLAFEVADDLEARVLLESARAAGGSLVEHLEVFDVFSGDPLGSGRKSIAFRVTLRAPDRTVTEEEQTTVRRTMVMAVVEASGGVLRGEV